MGVVNPNEKQPKTDEFSATFERELVANTAVRVTGVYTRNFNTYGLSDISPRRPVHHSGHESRSGARWPARHGRRRRPAITYYEYPSSLGGAAFAKTMFTNSDAADPKFKSFEVAFTKRPSQGMADRRVVLDHVAGHPDSVQRHRAQGSAAAILHGFGIPSGAPRIPTSPSTRPITPGSGRPRCPARITCRGGFWRRPTTISGAGCHRLGKCSLQGARPFASISLNVEPIGTFSLPNTHELDVRLAKRVNLGAAARSVELRADIYNALNKGTVRSWNLRVGRRTTCVPPRSCSRASSSSAPR